MLLGIFNHRINIFRIDYTAIESIFLSIQDIVINYSTSANMPDIISPEGNISDSFIMEEHISLSEVIINSQPTQEQEAIPNQIPPPPFCYNSC